MFTAGLVCLSSLAVALAFFWGSFGLTTLMSDPGGPAIVPRIVSGLVAIAALAELARLHKTRRLHRPLGETFRDFCSQIRSGVRAENSSAWRVLVVMALAVLFPALMQLVGFALASFVLIVLVGRICMLGWGKLLVIAIVMPLVLQFAFGNILDARIPRGSLIDLPLKF